MLELNPNTGKPRQIQHDLDQPKSHPSMCSPLSVPVATNWDAKAQQSSGNITQSREIIGRARRERASTWIQHSIVTAMGFQRHRDREKRHLQASGPCCLRGICHNSHCGFTSHFPAIFQLQWKEKNFLKCVYLIASNFHRKADEINKHRAEAANRLQSISAANIIVMALFSLGMGCFGQHSSITGCFWVTVECTKGLQIILLSKQGKRL